MAFNVYNFAAVIGGSLINITLFSARESCRNARNNQTLFLNRLSEMIYKVFAGTPSYESVQLIDFRCGSVIVDLTVKFNSPTKEQNVITILRNAAVDGSLADFIVRRYNESAVGSTTPGSSFDVLFQRKTAGVRRQKNPAKADC